MSNTATSTPIAIKMEPPASARGKGQTREFMDFLKANPGEWFKATFQVSSTPAKRDDYTLTTRQVPDSDPPRHDLYGIYGTPKVEAEANDEPV